MQDAVPIALETGANRIRLLLESSIAAAGCQRRSGGEAQPKRLLALFPKQGAFESHASGRVRVGANDLCAGVGVASHGGTPRLFPGRKRQAIKPRPVVCLAVLVHTDRS